MQYAGSQFNGSGYASQPSYGHGQYYQHQPTAIQHQYSGQQQQQYASTPYAGTVPFPQPSPYSAPPPLQSAPSQPPVHRPPRTQTPHPHRRHTTSGPATSARPLRPAIKKKPQRISSVSANGTIPAPAPLSRTRTHSHSGAIEQPQSRMHSIVRTRTNSSSRVDPGAHALIPLFSITSSRRRFFFFGSPIKTTFSCP
jgi:hypothetical protein